jgi:hypothetical protein
LPLADSIEPDLMCDKGEEEEMKKVLIAVALVTALMAAGSAQAATIIDFGSVAPGGGTILVSNGVYAGSGILVTSLGISGAPMHNGAYTIPDAVLSFKYNGTAGPSADNFFMIEGTFAPAGIPTGSTLLSGYFTSFSPAFPSNDLFAFQAGGPDVKNPDLLTFIGLPTNTPFSMFGFAIASRLANTPGTANFTAYEAFSTDISNTSVPEPGSMMLLGTGLFGLAGAVRRRLKK